MDKPGKKRPPIKFEPFPENKNLCVCSCIDNYLQRTSTWRKEENQLLLSFINPHGSVKPGTVSRWITEVLSNAGIDITIFTGHSTRASSSSKAKACDVPIKEILKKGYWSKTTTFERFYSKEINFENSNNGSFQRSILSCDRL